MSTNYRFPIFRRVVAAAAFFAVAAASSTQVTPPASKPDEPVALDAFVTVGSRFT